MRIALEAAYGTAFCAIGNGANILLRRVLNLECYRPVHVGSFIEIRGVALHVARAYIVVGLIGGPNEKGSGPWMDALIGFVQVDAEGRLKEFPQELAIGKPGAEWDSLQQRLAKLLKLRVRNGKKVSGEW